MASEDCRNQLQSFAELLFLQFGSLEDAFYTLDSEAVGCLSAESFCTSLRSLGYQEDPYEVFAALSSDGLEPVTLDVFMRSLAGETSPATIASRLDLVERSQQLMTQLIADMNTQLHSINEDGGCAGIGQPSSSAIADDVRQEVDGACQQILDSCQTACKVISEEAKAMCGKLEKRLESAEGLLRGTTSGKEMSSISPSGGFLTARLEEAYRGMDLKMFCSQEKFNSLEARVDNSMDSFKEKLSSLEARVDNSMENFQALAEDGLAPVWERLTATEEKLRSANSRLMYLEGMLCGQEITAKEHDNSIALVTEAIEQTQHMVSEFQKLQESRSDDLYVLEEERTKLSDHLATMTEAFERRAVTHVMAESRAASTGMVAKTLGDLASATTTELGESMTCQTSGLCMTPPEDWVRDGKSQTARFGDESQSSSIHTQPGFGASPLQLLQKQVAELLKELDSRPSWAAFQKMQERLEALMDPECQVILLNGEAQTVKSIQEGTRDAQLQLETVQFQIQELQKDASLQSVHNLRMSVEAMQQDARKLLQNASVQSIGSLHEIVGAMQHQVKELQLRALASASTGREDKLNAESRDGGCEESEVKRGALPSQGDFSPASLMETAIFAEAPQYSLPFASMSTSNVPSLVAPPAQPVSTAANSSLSPVSVQVLEGIGTPTDMQQPPKCSSGWSSVIQELQVQRSVTLQQRSVSPEPRPSQQRQNTYVIQTVTPARTVPNSPTVEQRAQCDPRGRSITPLAMRPQRNSHPAIRETTKQSQPPQVTTEPATCDLREFYIQKSERPWSSQQPQVILQAATSLSAPPSQAAAARCHLAKSACTRS
jgi:hypothetical protein